jgi:hypothetical protein
MIYNATYMTVRLYLDVMGETLSLREETGTHEVNEKLTSNSQIQAQYSNSDLSKVVNIS